MTIEKPVTGIDLVGGEPRVAVETQFSCHRQRVGVGFERIGEREREEMEPDARGGAIDLVDRRQDRLTRRRPIRRRELTQESLKHGDIISGSIW